MGTLQYDSAFRSSTVTTRLCCRLTSSTDTRCDTQWNDRTIIRKTSEKSQSLPGSQKCPAINEKFHNLIYVTVVVAILSSSCVDILDMAYVSSF